MRHRLLLLTRPQDKVLGKTVTGKPVHRIGKPKPREFTKADHASAARIHQREQERYARRSNTLAGQVFHQRDDSTLQTRRAFKSATGMELHHSTMMRFHKKKAGGLLERLILLLESNTNLNTQAERYGWKTEMVPTAYGATSKGYQHSPGVHASIMTHPKRPGEELHILRHSGRKQQGWMHLTPTDQYEDDGAETLHKHMRFLGIKRWVGEDLDESTQGVIGNALDKHGWVQGEGFVNHNPPKHLKNTHKGTVVTLRYTHPSHPGYEFQSHGIVQGGKSSRGLYGGWSLLKDGQPVETGVGANWFHHTLASKLGMKRAKIKRWKDRFYEDVEMLDEKTRSSFQVLKDSKVALSDDERKQVHAAKAVWHHGPNGEPTSAVWKSVVRGKTFYVTNTHRAMAKRPTLKGAISIYHSFIKSTA